MQEQVHAAAAAVECGRIERDYHGELSWWIGEEEQLGIGKPRGEVGRRAPRCICKGFRDNGEVAIVIVSLSYLV